MDTSLLNHHTAGVEDQLSCSGATILAVAYIAAFVAAIKFIFAPRIRRLIA